MDISDGRRKLQGPEPAPLKVGRNSRKIAKHDLLPRSRGLAPVMVHLRPAQVIHVKPEQFMGLVQHLTGKTNNTVSAVASECEDETNVENNLNTGSVGSKGHYGNFLNFV